MTRDEIVREVTTLIQQGRNGNKSENSKFDFKRQWFNLKTEEGINQFLRHACAIANTFGPDGLMVIGYDEDKNLLYNTVFTDSGLSDLSDLTNLVASRVDRLFSFSVIPMDFEGSTLNVIHIPPSIDKPHLIVNYQTFTKDGKSRSEKERIFVRKNTDSLIASRHDIELMYYDRKNIIPEYELSAYYPRNNISFLSGYGEIQFRLRTPLTLENTGRRPVAISSMELKIGPYKDEMFFFETFSYKENNLLISPKGIYNGGIEFLCHTIFHYNNEKMVKLMSEMYQNRKHLEVSDLTIKLVTGHILSIKLADFN